MDIRLAYQACLPTSSFANDAFGKKFMLQEDISVGLREEWMGHLLDTEGVK